MFGQRAHGAQQPGHVRVVTASVHDPGVSDAYSSAVSSVTGSGIHVGAAEHDPAVAVLDDRDDAGLADALRLEAKALQHIFDVLGSVVLFHAELGVAVQVLVVLEQPG